MRLFTCQACRRTLHFENTLCEKCCRRLGYLPATASLSAIEADGDAWRALASARHTVPFCINDQYDACNWLIEAQRRNALPVLPAQSDNPRHRSGRQRPGVAQDRTGQASPVLFVAAAQAAVGDEGLSSPKSGSPSISSPTSPSRRAEGDDRARQRPDHHRPDGGRRRRAGEEPGRHARALSHSARPFPPRDRPLFLGPAGAGRRPGSRLAARCSATSALDYGQALQRHYEQGAPADWQSSFVTAYATMHPWEDFAETWAHYLHIVDTLETAGAFGLSTRPEAGAGRRAGRIGRFRSLSRAAVSSGWSKAGCRSQSRSTA